MMVNSDDEEHWEQGHRDFNYSYSDDESMGYQNPRPSLAESVDEILIPAPTKKEASPYEFPESSFMNHPARSVTDSPNVAQRCATSAGCNKIVVESLNDTLPSQINSIIDTLEEGEAEKMKKQLEKESLAQWESGIIYKGLGVDENGNFQGLSLIRLNDLLCNVNEHLLIMRRDIIQYGQAISQSRQKGTLDSLGFNNNGNRHQLKRICKTITQANQELAVHVENLVDYIEGNEQKSSGLFKALMLTTGIVLVGGAAFCGIYHAKQNVKLI